MKYRMLLLLIAAVVLALFASLCFGTVFISPHEIFSVITGSATEHREILTFLRIPRTAAAFLIGASLAVSGALFQSLLKNPLADPYTLGVSGGSSFGASIAIIAGLSYTSVAFSALAAGSFVALSLYIFSRRINAEATTFILAGIAMSIFFSSAVMLLFALAESHDVHKALLWLMGDISLARTGFLVPTGSAAIILIVCAFFYAPHLNLLSYGTSYAHNAGVARADSAAIFWIASALTALSVSLCGVVSFVGLIIPHFVRKITGHDHRTLVPLSAIAGGSFLTLCDTFGRVIAYPFEIPSGVITGFIGGIFLVVILVKSRRD
jgi:iron complex transport system permease protein